MANLINIPEEEGISYEIACLAQRKGYPFQYIQHDGYQVPTNLPTLSDMQRWLRLAHGRNMYIDCHAGTTCSVFVYGSEFGFIYKHTQKANNPTIYDTYEEGQAAGILEMLALIAD